MVETLDSVNVVMEHVSEGKLLCRIPEATGTQVGEAQRVFRRPHAVCTTAMRRASCTEI